jgi:tetratricopeptide (TPR) repeat protein
VERNAQLGPVGIACGAAAALEFLAICLAFMLSVAARAQCRTDPQQVSRIHRSFEQQNWTEVVHQAASLPCRPADSNFEYGLALAHLQRLQEARAALMEGRRQSRAIAQERFDVELAGIAFEQKRYPEAAAWLRRALELDSKDEYANNFAATVYFLLGNVEAALKYWNRVQKPYIAELRFDPQLRVRRLLLDRAFVFAPASVLRQPDYLATEERLDALNIFPTYTIALNARASSGSGPSFDASFHAVERDRFGSSRAQALLSTFGGAVYETIYPSYFNIGRSAANFESLLRWDSQKYRAWLSLSAPVRSFPQFRWSLTTDERDENWTIRSSFTGIAPPLGSLNLQRETVAGSFAAVPTGRLKWSLGAELSHRAYRHVVYGSALTPALVTSGFELKQLASVSYKLLDIPERRFLLTTGANSEAARLWSNPSHIFDKLQGSALAHWFPEAADNRYEAQEQLRAGRTFGTAPFDETFMLGVERDNDLWLRGHIGTRDRQKGSAPLGYNYLLANSDFYRRIYTNGLFDLHAGPLLDIGRMGAPTSGLSTPEWLFDCGAEARLSVLGVHVVLTYGHDLRNGSNAVYGTLTK